MSLGDKILNERKKKGLSQEELGNRIDVTRQTISNWELGETNPNPEQLKLLSKELNISIDELLDNDIKSVLVEKTSNTEKLAGLILKILKIIGVIILAYFVLLVLMLVGRNSVNVPTASASIQCTLDNETYTYGFKYKVNNGEIVSGGGNTYLLDNTGASKYSNVHNALDAIDTYIKTKGGTCTKELN